MVFVSETYLVVYAALFCSAWWRRDLGQMQSLLINAPTKQGFYKSFKACKGRRMNVEAMLQRQLSTLTDGAGSFSTARAFLEQCIEEVDQDKMPVWTRWSRCYTGIFRECLKSIDGFRTKDWW